MRGAMIWLLGRHRILQRPVVLRQGVEWAGRPWV